MLCHFLHDEGIADQEAHDFRRVEPSLLTQNRAVIEFHEHHQPGSWLNLIEGFFAGCDPARPPVDAPRAGLVFFARLPSRLLLTRASVSLR
jgi:hypothetical protein